MFEQLEQLAAQRAEQAVQTILDAEDQFQRLAATMARDALPIDPDNAADILAWSNHSVSDLRAAVKIHSLRFEGERCAKDRSNLRDRRIDLHSDFGKAEEAFEKVRAAHDAKQLELVDQIRDVEDQLNLAAAWFRDRDNDFDGRAFREIAANAPYQPTEAEAVSAQVQKCIRADLQLKRQTEANDVALRAAVARLGELDATASTDDATDVAAQALAGGSIVSSASGETMLYGAPTGNVTFDDFIQAEVPMDAVDPLRAA